jgi:hypothetical protein
MRQFCRQRSTLIAAFPLPTERGMPRRHCEARIDPQRGSAEGMNAAVVATNHPNPIAPSDKTAARLLAELRGRPLGVTAEAEDR